MLRLKAKLGPKAQVVIPQPVRERLGVRPGDEVAFRVEGSRIIVEREDPEEWLRRFLGIVKGPPRRGFVLDSDKLYDEMMEERFPWARRKARRRSVKKGR